MLISESRGKQFVYLGPAKISRKLQPSPLYEENKLSYEAVNQIFVQSKSIANFAKSVMLQLFDQTELARCHVAHARASGAGSEPAIHHIDQKRVEIIRQIVEQNFFPSKHQWSDCIEAMGKYAKTMKSRPISN